VSNQCQSLVEESDKDRFLASLYAPADLRPHLFALYAFDVELSRIPQRVSEPMIRQIRLQWWRDSISAIYAGGVQDHPVAIALAAAVKQASWPEQALQGMIDARETDFCAEAQSGIEALERFLGLAFSTPIQLACLLLGQSCADAAGLSGVAYGIGKSLLREPAQGLDRALLADHAKSRLQEARAVQPPPAVLPAFLHVSLTEAYLRAGAKGTADLLPLSRQFIVWRAGRRNRF
jgi:Squalene/phytoene synthase